MPTYVYRCDDCGHQFEIFQRMSEDPIDTCPGCQSRVRRVIHPVGVVFKGSGWYINDSRSNGSAANEDSTSTGQANDGSDKSTDTKAANSNSNKDTKSEPAKTAAD